MTRGKTYFYGIAVDEKTHLKLKEIQEKLGFTKKNKFMLFVIQSFIQGYDKVAKEYDKTS